MKIDKIIFAADDSYFIEFWPIQAKICKQVLDIEPVLFHITDEDGDFYDDGNGLVKKIKKIPGINSGIQAAIGRMFFTKFFPNEVCVVSDIDLLLINKDYIQNQIKDFKNDSIVLYLSDAYDFNRPEVILHYERSDFPYIQEMYCYHYNAATGNVFNKILGTDCSFKEYLDKHIDISRGKLFWCCDEFYFAECINNKNHGIKIHKLKRGYTSPWLADKRIERHNFPVTLEAEGEIEYQEKYGIYDIKKLKDGYYIDVNCCRPYSKYKKEIDKIVDIVLNKEMKDMYCLGVEFNTDKITYHRYDRIYEKFLKNLRDKELILFEIGCGEDASSFYMWHEYFPYSKIFCMDINEERKTERGEVFKGDQSKKEDLDKAIEYVGLCDIIIDDGSHHPLHQINTFSYLFKNMLSPGGIYIIEDIECNYWKPGNTIYGYEIGNENIIDFFSNYQHKINSEFSKVKNHLNVSSITYYKNCIILIKKTEEEIEDDKRLYRFNDML